MKKIEEDFRKLAKNLEFADTRLKVGTFALIGSFEYACVCMGVCGHPIESWYVCVNRIF